MKIFTRAFAGLAMLCAVLVAGVMYAPSPVIAQSVGFFQQVGAGAVVRTIVAKLRENVTVTDFGADPTGSADSSTAFNDAITAAPSNGCEIKIPVGTYKIGSSIAVNKTCKITGAGRAVTLINVNSATADIFNVTGTKSELAYFSMATLVTRTAGSYIKANTIRVNPHDIYMDGAYIGVTFTDNSTLSYARDIECRNVTPHATAANSACVVVGKAGGGTNPNTVVLDRIVSADDSPASPQRSCINILSADATSITNTQCLQGQVGLLINPGSGDGVLSTKVTASYFDSTTVSGAYISPSSTGNVARVWVSGSWFTGSGGDGIHLDYSGSGIATAFECVGCQISLNTFGSGLNIANATWTDVRVIGGCIGQNSVGVTVPAAFSKFSARGSSIGTCDGFTANTTGILLGGGASNEIVITDNDFVGSTTPVTITSPLSGTNNLIGPNANYATDIWGTGVPAKSATSPLAISAAGAVSCTTCGVTGSPLSQFAATTSAQLAGVISDETGTGALVFGTSPTFSTGITTPLIIGGTGTGSTVTYKTTTGVGATDAHIWQIGNNGATEGMRLNATGLGIGTNNPGANLHVNAPSGTATMKIQNTSGNADFSYAVGSVYFTNNGSADINFLANGSVSNVTFGPGSGTEKFRMDYKTHFKPTGTAPALTSCGTTPAISGTDMAGEVTMGTGSPTGCVITFANAFAAAPYCVVTWKVNITSMQYAVSTSAITLTQTGTSSNKVNYVCIGG